MKARHGIPAASLALMLGSMAGGALIREIGMKAQ
jgi:hypothetical protein